MRAQVQHPPRPHGPGKPSLGGQRGPGRQPLPPGAGQAPPTALPAKSWPHMSRFGPRRAGILASPSQGPGPCGQHPACRGTPCEPAPPPPARPALRFQTSQPSEWDEGRASLWCGAGSRLLAQAAEGFTESSERERGEGKEEGGRGATRTEAGGGGCAREHTRTRPAGRTPDTRRGGPHPPGRARSYRTPGPNSSAAATTRP